MRASKGCAFSTVRESTRYQKIYPKEEHIGDNTKAMDSTDDYMGDADLGNRSHLPQPSSGNRRQGQRTLATVYDAVAGELKGSEISLSQESGN